MQCIVGQQTLEISAPRYWVGALSRDAERSYAATVPVLTGVSGSLVIRLRQDYGFCDSISANGVDLPAMSLHLCMA